MKTLTYLPTLLALTIQVIVIGQTQNNQTHKIRVDIMGPKEPVKMNYANSNVTMSIKEYEELLSQVQNLKIDAKKLREEALSIEEQSLSKQLQASELSGKISLQNFEQNKTIILGLFTRIPKNNITYTKVNVSYIESVRFMKLAIEMREEANAQLTIQAKYGNMSNAEEKEALALAKQQEILNLIDQTYPQLNQNLLTLVSKKQTTSNPEPEAFNKSSEEVAVIESETSMDLLASAVQQAVSMKITVQQLKQKALISSPNQKNILKNEAISLENDIISKQTEISMLKSKMDYDKFTQNRTVIALLVEQIKDNTNLVSKVNQLNNEAERLMKMGKEMREEANAQLTIAAKYGAMSNAEETETMALGKQYASIQLIERNSTIITVASR